MAESYISSLMQLDEGKILSELNNIAIELGLITKVYQTTRIYIYYAVLARVFGNITQTIAQYLNNMDIEITTDEALNSFLKEVRNSIGEKYDKILDTIGLSHLKNEKEMLSPYGISAVDMSAGYFVVNGYWNGNVWFPHQWFIWKSMLDMGETDFAYKIAQLALDVWKREVDYSYYTFEMVNVVTGRGGWFHNFGGLSTPITMWANAYHKAGTLNTGFDTWVDEVNFSDDNTKLDAKITYFGKNEKITVIATMNDDENKNYKVTLDGKEISFSERFKGTLEIEFSVQDNDVHKLEIR